MGQRGVELKHAKKTGKQNITKGGDFGARKAWADAHSPANVKGMVGSSGEFSKVKHNEGSKS